MTKGELVKGLAELKGVKKKEAESMISLVDEIIELAAKGEGKTKVGKFVTVEVVDVEAKSGVAMGKEWHKPAHKELKIKQVKSTKEM